MINYLGKFLPQLSDVSEPLRNLTKEQNQFNWSKVHQDAFNKLTQLISEPPLLRYYDLEEEVTIETDASDYELGAVLLQAGRLRDVTLRSRRNALHWCLVVHDLTTISMEEKDHNSHKS